MCGRLCAARTNVIARAEVLGMAVSSRSTAWSQYRRRLFLDGAVKGGRELQQHELCDWLDEGHRALQVMENHLQDHRYFAADRYTIADIALYAHTHLAP